MRLTARDEPPDVLGGDFLEHRNSGAEALVEVVPAPVRVQVDPVKPSRAGPGRVITARSPAVEVGRAIRVQPSRQC
jgi:hypothetical protein